MTNVDEFSLIAEQLAWLDRHVRAGSAAGQDDRLDEALKALTCARAVIEELAQIGRAIDQPTPVKVT